MRTFSFGPLLAAGVLLLVCADPATAQQVIVVKIADMAFSPATVTAKVGDTVEWVNEDFLDHTATAKDEAFDLEIAAGQTRSQRLTKAGTIDYFCRFHPNMTGTIHVD